jgi:hypothetical protein
MPILVYNNIEQRGGGLCYNLRLTGTRILSLIKDTVTVTCSINEIVYH